ncbi:hypothetical protein U9M48_011817 [Paspalum notatum var. saurae]|uniref:Uncharacterized protein n=1 Tax=Paspalum notatum var. saurae TaxID=547442 RepID=A0AAQ3WHR3_PASNO
MSSPAGLCAPPPSPRPGTPPSRPHAALLCAAAGLARRPVPRPHHPSASPPAFNRVRESIPSSG